jgi:3-hydroxybutyryl-CoA dehydrogenase
MPTAGVIGAGTMGNGIAHVFARAGYDVILCDREQRLLDRGIETIRKNLGRETSSGKVTEAQAAEALARVRGVLNLEPFAACDLAIEAATEQFEIKAAILKELDRVLPPQAVIATNTSSISITKLAAQTSRPSQVIGMHFFNPVPVMKLVEVVRGLETSQAVVEGIHDLARKLGKTPIEARDSPGFISNRVLMPLLNEAMYAVMEGVGSAEAVDEIFRLGMAHPMGPLALADFIGLDVCLHILRVLEDAFGEKFRPCPLLVRMVDAGWMGRKSGKGFYAYAK